MANDLTIIKDNWLELSDNLKAMPMPFEHDIFLQECHVAGTMYIDDILIKTKSLTEGSTLNFKREADNRFDDLAIAVVNAEGERVGYVPRAYNQVFAHLLDAGKLLVGKVTHKAIEDERLNLRMAINLRDI